ncbi:hypothetical protein GCM10010052_19590 [Paenarthrobacter histidinolovorans]|nr:hypothetical protein GCM10010052_19590 [Paenarthrobacter histidinolovorans]
MKSILHRQAQGRERGLADRRPAEAYAPSGLATVPGRRVSRPLLAPASTALWNRPAAGPLKMKATRPAPSYSLERQALATGNAARHRITASDSADLFKGLAKAVFQMRDNLDSQDGCEDGCHYCTGPETD